MFYRQDSSDQPRSRFTRRKWIDKNTPKSRPKQPRPITDGLTNHGIIRGGGIIDGDITNAVDGQIRVDAGEYLTFGGANFDNVGGAQVIGGELEVGSRAINNFGTIEVIGGTFRLGGGIPLNNAVSTGLITARGGILRFDDGLINDGSIGVSFGTTDIFGDVENKSTGIINVSGGANVTFFEDLDQNGTMIVARVGSSRIEGRRPCRHVWTPRIVHFLFSRGWQRCRAVHAGT